MRLDRIGLLFRGVDMASVLRALKVYYGGVTVIMRYPRVKMVLTGVSP
jgi:hypothetical protein